jgi:hypothetical protein
MGLAPQFWKMLPIPGYKIMGLRGCNAFQEHVVLRVRTSFDLSMGFTQSACSRIARRAP